MFKRAIIPVILAYICNAQEVIDGVAAIVGENIILRSDVEQLALLNAAQLNINPKKNPDKYTELLKTSLELLINENILLEEAKIETIEVEDREVEALLDQQIQNMISQAGSKEKVEEILGKSLPQIKREYRPIIKNRLIAEKLRSQKFSNIKITRREVEEFYETFKDSLPEIPPSIDFSHILIKVEPGEEEEIRAKSRADSILSLLRNGEDFSRLAEIYSDDPGTAYNGGEIGYITRGGFIKGFEEVAFSLEKGEISDVVKTELGYHIIQQLDKKGEKINVRHILIKPKISQNNINNSVKLIDSIRVLLINNQISFDSAAYKYSDDIDAKKNFGAIRIPKNMIQDKTFLSVLDTLEIGEISQVFETSSGFHIIKLNGVYDDTWTTLERWALENKRRNMYKEWIDKLKSKFYIEIKTLLSR